VRYPAEDEPCHFFSFLYPYSSLFSCLRYPFDRGKRTGFFPRTTFCASIRPDCLRAVRNFFIAPDRSPGVLYSPRRLSPFLTHPGRVPHIIHFFSLSCLSACLLPFSPLDSPFPIPSPHPFTILPWAPPSFPRLVFFFQRST